ncbi:tRNA 4-thiouridine(8) synthase ThiI [Moraxella caviae]|uniref:tRNA sulfurtransferase n=1 Tax=Moraxella caviae TaxID=34060 RepID=A0A1T0A669_9GAMM|nr:tRNA uracil 4-sulfurtransferase ThiI [Moraxella caviae]OOR91177.1 tRNA 4-thiouridine(8) synthase ThiI [Moraxella caviae]STZ13788.1 tRNA sulfurtransferase [Moraxella caviae]VEW13022.1 tRNA sulfurtransferase [Moraxella caviae]
MKFIVKVFPEIMMKGDSIRKRFMKVLTNNIREILTRCDDTVAVVRHWDFIEVRSKDESKRAELVQKMQCISGIHHILQVEESSFTDMHDIYEQVLARFGARIENKTFCVRVKRRGKHTFSSMDVMQYVGGGLNQAVASAKVKLVNPDVTVKFEVADDKLLFITERFEGLSGYPMSTQEDVLSLISGGFDSGVASFQFIRRGSRVHYLFFNLGGAAHEIGTKQMAYELWKKYASSHKVRFTTVDFAPVVAEILEKIDDGQMGVVLKRMMVRAASQVAKRGGIEAIVTGEALGQVASQTLTNLHLIDKAADVLVLRPLITHDKPTIISIAEEIGTADIAKSMPEFCGVISKSPTAKAVEEKLIATEQNFDFTILDDAVANAVTIDIRKIAEQNAPTQSAEQVNSVGANDVILDIRAPDEVDDEPLVVTGANVITMPFYRLGSSFASLDQSKTYLLYCKKGVMSGLQAMYLKDQGFDNVKVYKKA